jgi:hypothetical protein
MGFKKGESGNPKGRPPKERALTTILETAGDVKLDYNGNKVEAKKFLAAMLWDAAVHGKVRFADGRADVLSSDDWFSIVQFIYKHVDGQPRREVDVTSAGEPITLNIVGVISDDDDADDTALPPAG